MINKTASGRYRVRVKVRGRVVADQTFAQRRQAEAWERQQRARIDSSGWVDPVAVSGRALGGAGDGGPSGAGTAWVIPGWFAGLTRTPRGA